MKRITLGVLIALCLVFGAMAFAAEKKAIPDALTIIHNRKSVRNFTGQSVDAETLASGLPYAKMLDKAGAAIIVCALPEKAFQKKTEFAILDASCASENILLAIEALGLGGVWTAVYPEPDRMSLVRSVLGIPEDVIPLNVIPVGYPVGTEKPQDKFKAENIHWEKW